MKTGGCHACCSSCPKPLWSCRWYSYVLLNTFFIPPKQLLKNRFFQVSHCSWVTPWSPLCIYRQKCYHWVLLQWNLQKWSYSRLLQPYFPVICLRIQFLAIFGHFPLYVPTHGWPLDPISAFIDKSIITGCCCNDIYEVRPVLRHGKHQKYCHFGNFDAPACLVLITNFRQFRGNCLGLPRKL